MQFGQQTNFGCGLNSWWVQRRRGEHQTIFDDFRWEDSRIVAVSVIQTIPFSGERLYTGGICQLQLLALCYSISSTIAKTSPRCLLWFLSNEIFVTCLCALTFFSTSLFWIGEVKLHGSWKWNHESKEFVNKEHFKAHCKHYTHKIDKYIQYIRFCFHGGSFIPLTRGCLHFGCHVCMLVMPYVLQEPCKWLMDFPQGRLMQIKHQ